MCCREALSSWTMCKRVSVCVRTYVCAHICVCARLCSVLTECITEKSQPQPHTCTRTRTRTRSVLFGSAGVCRAWRLLLNTNGFYGEMNRLFLSSDKQYCLRLNQAAVSREGGEQRGYDEGTVATRDWGRDGERESRRDARINVCVTVWACLKVQTCSPHLTT